MGVLVVSFKGRRHDPDEFYELVRSADFQIKFSCSAAVDKPDVRTYVRSGKLQELKMIVYTKELQQVHQIS